MTLSLFLKAWLRAPALKSALAATVACALIAGCGGDEGSDAAQAGDGEAAAQVPIVAPPSGGSCPDGGTDATQPPPLNSTLDCAP